MLSVKYWEIIAEQSQQSRDGVGAASQRRGFSRQTIVVPTRIAATESVSLCGRMKKV